MNRLIQSLQAEGAPPHILAAFEVLQFRNPTADRLGSLVYTEQQRFLAWCDARQVSLMLPYLCGLDLPAWVSEQVQRRSARYDVRFQRLKDQLFEIVQAFNREGLEFVMLKGLSHSPALTADARLRGQGDIDLWIPGLSVYKARDVLKRLGYVPTLESKSRHLAPMRRPGNWTWQGDQFDPEMPISVELHYELWSEEAEHVRIPDLQPFWQRKEVREFDGWLIPVLREEDLLGFACLHFLLHLLHGEVPVQRAWEIARFLDLHSSDAVFWTSWDRLHPVALRQLEICVFYLVTCWFGCRSWPQMETDFEQLPGNSKLWLTRYGFAPLIREWAPNKSEIWLHLALIGNNTGDKLRVLARRLIPIALPAFSDTAVPERHVTAKLLRAFRQLRLITARLVRHLITFVPTLFDGLRWLYVCRLRSSDDSPLMRIR